MNAAPTVAVCVAVAVAVTAGSKLFDSDRATRAAADGGEAAELAHRLDELARAQDELREAVEGLAVRPAPAAGARRTVGEIEAAVERYLAERAAGAEEAAPAETEEDAGSLIARLDVPSILEMLGDEDRPWIEREELWQKLREEGRLDEVLAEYERLAELYPNDPDRKVDLGYAYIQKIQEVGQSALAGKWATKADEQFEAALALDETHWEARYMKAVSLSHWPAFTGKAAEAIGELETLVEIQKQQPLEDEHAETYLTLGNMYLSQGKDAEALEAWQAGLALFPTHAGLQAQVDALK